MKIFFGLGLITICLTVHYAHALKCFNCNETAGCRDENFQDHNQASADCMFNSGPGFCIKLKWAESGKVSRYCQSKEATPLGAGCLPLDVLFGGENVMGCACNYKDNCNGPVGVANPQPGGLQCYDCYLNPECKDEEFDKHNQTLVNCGKGSCIKTRLKSSGLVHRHCSTTNVKSRCFDETYDGVDAQTCICDSNGCNGASVVHMTFLGLGLIIILSLLAA